jgi:hypothetical protein
MIDLNTIAAWGKEHPWPSAEQIEQDLILSRAICEIAHDGYLGAELVFRGGTALNKLYLDKDTGSLPAQQRARPLRYLVGFGQIET